MDELVQNTMDSYNKYLLKLPSGCQKIADDIRKDSMNVALKGIIDFSEGASWLIEVNRLLEKKSFPNPLNSKKINDFLNEINSGLEIQDFVIVADMFEYEIKPFFEKCIFYNVSNVR